MNSAKSKRFAASAELRPKEALPLAEGVAALKGFKPTKFDQTVELVMHLGIDPRQADQALRGAIALPHGIGSVRCVIAFCEGDDVAAALEAGASEAGSDELIKKVQDGWLGFDVAVSTPAMMKNVSKLGRVLGPQGKMPSPKAGTVSPDISKVVKEYVAGKVEYRNDDGGNIHIVVGKLSFDEVKLVENAETFIKLIKKLKPASTKGVYIKKVCITATMSPSVEILMH